MNENQERFCFQCDKPIQGRKDKKFCDYHCRTEYHNDLRKISEVYMNKVNLILRHNRAVLLRFCPEGKSLAFEIELRRLGFAPEIFTNFYTSKSGGNVYRLCYEFGYRLNPKYKGQYIIVRFNFNDPNFVLQSTQADIMNPDLIP